MNLTRRTAAGMLGAAALVTVHPAAAVARPPGLEGVPRVAHVVIVVLENESFAATWSPSSPAHYLNSLVPHGAFVPQYYATGHVSLDNYIAMTSGVAGPQVVSTYTDCLGLNLYACAQEVSVASSGNLADQVEGAGLRWKLYADGTSAPCTHDSYAPTAGPDSFQGDQSTPESATAGPNYADRHVPFLYYDDVVGNQARCDAHLRPFTELHHDLTADTLPDFAFVTPDTCDDGHDAPCADGRAGGLTTADAFLHTNLPALITYLRAHDGLLLVTFDEASPSDTGGCCHGGPAGQAGFGGQVGLLALGPMVHAGTTSAHQYDHASLLRTVEDALGISAHLNNAAASDPMADIWASVPAAAASPAASPVASPAPTLAEGLPDTAPAAPETGMLWIGGGAAAAAALAVRRRRRRD